MFKQELENGGNELKFLSQGQVGEFWEFFLLNSRTRREITKQCQLTIKYSEEFLWDFLKRKSYSYMYTTDKLILAYNFSNYYF